jgi:hypothetical protein
MNSTAWSSRNLIAPVVLAGLAVMVPLAMAGQPAAVVESRASIVARSGDQHETLVELVSEAAKQFCGQQVAIAAGSPVVFAVDMPVVGVVVEPQLSDHAPLASLSPGLIDLPPPVR